MYYYQTTIGRNSSHNIEKRSVSVSHDEYETIAQSACSSMAISRNLPGWTFAVQKLCISGQSDNCVQICNSVFLRVQDQQTAHSRWSCIGALHIYKGRPSSSPSTLNHPSIGLKVYWSSTYHNNGYCGPNYCCCRAY